MSLRLVRRLVKRYTSLRFEYWTDESLSPSPWNRVSLESLGLSVDGEESATSTHSRKQQLEASSEHRPVGVSVPKMVDRGIRNTSKGCSIDV